MNGYVFILAICVSAMLALLADDRLTADKRNVARLAEHFGWPRSDAADAYAMARRVGFGAAYDAMRAKRRLLTA